MALRGEGENREGDRAVWSWVDAPDVFEDEGLLQRLRANNDALESLRQALDDDSSSLVRSSRRAADCCCNDELEAVIS